MHAVRESWGGEAFRGRRRSSPRNTSSLVEPTQKKEESLSVGEAWGKKTHTERSMGNDSYPISEDLLPPFENLSLAVER